MSIRRPRLHVLPRRTTHFFISLLLVAVVLSQGPLPMLTPQVHASTSTFFSTLSSLFGVQKAKSAWNTLFAAAPYTSYTAQAAGASTLTLGNTSSTGSTNVGNANYITTSRFTMPAHRGSLESISVFIADSVSPAPNNRYSMAVYRDDAGAPGALVATTSQGTLLASAWNTLPITGDLAANASYWLAYTTNAATRTANNLRTSAGQVGQFAWRPQTFGTWPSTFGAPQGRANQMATIYVTYVPDLTPDTTAPTTPASLVASVDPAYVQLTWASSTDDIGVTGYRVERCMGDGCTTFAQIAETLTTTYTDHAVTQETTYQYRVRAIDAAGNLSNYSTPYTALVPRSLTDIIPPTLSFTAPTADSVVSGTVTLGVSASDAVGVTSVQFIANGVYIGAPDTEAPFTATWNTATATDGTHVLSAIARDAAGNEAVTAITVSKNIAFSNLLPAFPGAQGGGAESLGGRGGRAIEVTNLNDAGAGSLRACVDASGPRTCVFRVGGIIRLQTPLWVSRPYLRIAGQTAPGDGVLLAPAPGAVISSMLGIAADHVIVQYLRVRHEYVRDCDEVAMGTNTECGALMGVSNGRHIMFDHNSLSWTQDDSYGVWSGLDRPLRNVSFADNLIAEGFSSHSTSLITGASTPALAEKVTDVDMYRNLMMNDNHRNPLLKNKSARVVNNLFYNQRFYVNQVGAGVQADIIANHYKRGPLNGSSAFREIQAWSTPNGSSPGGNPSVYVAGNVGWNQTNPLGTQLPMTRMVTGENGTESGAVPSEWFRSGPLPATRYPITAASIAEITSASGSVVPTVGASRRLDCLGNLVPNRDSVDIRLIDQYLNNTGITSLVATSTDITMPTMTSGTACADTDHDGMPDQWEIGMGLNPNDATDGPQVAANRYTNLENYLNGVMGVSAADTTPPTTPSNLAAVAGVMSVGLTWNASTDAVGVTEYRVERCAGLGCTTFTQIGTTSGLTYTDTEVMSGTTYEYRVRARDAAGNLSVYSVSASAATTDTTIPTVSITSPGADAVVIGNVSVAASASDNTGVAGVQFMLDGVAFGSEDVTSPYEIVWDTTESLNGAHALSAVARDVAGNRATTTLSVTVANTLSTTFTLGNEVVVATGPLNVRATPNGTLLGTQETGMRGTVVGGPVVAGATTWWHVNYATGVDGWSAEQYLVAYVPPVPTATLTVSPVSIDSGQSATLSWTSTETAACMGTGFATQGMRSGDVVVTPATSTVYTLTCTGLGGTTTAAATLVVTVPVDATPPTVTNVTLSNLTQYGFTVSWDTDEESTSHVEYGTSITYGQTTLLDTTLVQTHAQTVTGLQPGRTYHYRVVSRDAAGNDANSSDYSITTPLNPDTTAPATPGNLSASAATTTQVSIAWNSSVDPVVVDQITSGVRTYHLYGCEGTTCTPTTEIYQGSSVSYLHTALRAGTTYRYRVVAEDNAGNLSVTSTNVSVTTPTTPPPPDTTAPTISGVLATGVSTASERITWTTNEPARSVVRYGKTRTTLNQSVSTTTLSTSHSTLISGLSRNTTYYYQLTVTDAAGNARTSSILSFKTLATKPAQLSNVSARQGSVIITWDPYTDDQVQGIVVFRSTTGYPTGKEDELLTTLAATTTEYHDLDVVDDTQYFYTLYAQDADGTRSDPVHIAFRPAKKTTHESSGSGSSGGGGKGSSSGGGSGGSKSDSADKKDDTTKTSTSTRTSEVTVKTGTSTLSTAVRESTKGEDEKKWIHGITPTNKKESVIPNAAAYGKPYFKYRGTSAPLLKAHQSGDLIILVAGSGSSLQKIGDFGTFYKDGKWETFVWKGVRPKNIDGTYTGMTYYILRTTDPLYTKQAGFTAGIRMNLPGCDNASCKVDGWLLQEYTAL
jgi:pectate lyase